MWIWSANISHKYSHFVPASPQLPQTPRVLHHVCLSQLYVSDALSVAITFKFVSNYHFQEDSLTWNPGHVPYLGNNSIVHHTIYRIVHYYSVIRGYLNISFFPLD